MYQGSGIVQAEQFLKAVVPLYDPENEHMAKTASRFAAMIKELTHPDPGFEFTVFESKQDEMIVLSPMPFYTLCAHHVVPFYGEAHIAYIPDQKIAGLSKFPRLVKQLSKGLWVQENLTTHIADVLIDKLAPIGVAVIMQAEHLCMAMRGVRQPGVVTTTSAMRGVFYDPEKTAKAEFLRIIKLR
jgi:GTP cyclohydrolase IA